MKQLSGVGVLDKAALVLTAVEAGPASLADLVARTGLTRATAHRLAQALEVHRLLGRTADGRFVSGPRLAAGTPTPLPWDLLDRAGRVLAELREVTGESAQLYVRRGALRHCVAASERASGLRDTVPVGAALPMTAGSGAQVLLAFAAHPEPELLAGALFDEAVLRRVRDRGWAESIGERERGLASVSAPVHDGTGTVIAAVSLSGPVERLTRSPGRRHRAAVLAAAARLSTPAVG
ncbi:IclR family transcriptional regulator [Frankia sp. CcI156]|uniref:Transcriptional regulator, IclR family n=1 Tax=Frankia casuarinae (strain DSM 45818 / CECT 9043 / HFP020203 / CcI3) TaxID=106370 RepID=Q2J6W8_FRACC|nr:MULTISPECIES: IclR family transcriptional regulator C-terminal domain-containing protein [Frankia]ABD12974.1 transcriptional regulator, IclR family [Frankia casuarinae]ETA03579.1 transcriptional regulator, IclR family [Frankia sp. CcI6]EYT93470.1 transcriptional regulator, IclR family [Frankia casuarinae]KDA43767.1 transcriptional regulator, IclR family [Frankia sp. BMG5.23]KEZ36144.1 transcriptional regulator, IclR family [Frankia sp. CeD]